MLYSSLNQSSSFPKKVIKFLSEQLVLYVQTLSQVQIINKSLEDICANLLSFHHHHLDKIDVDV